MIKNHVALPCDFFYTFPMNKFLDQQHPNLILWAPFVLAAGAVVYFVWPVEPVITMPWLIAVLCAITFIFVTRSFNRNKIRINYYLPLASLLIFGFGFFYATASTRSMATPTIPRDLRDIEITGTVLKIDYTAERTRVYVNIDTDYYSSYQTNKMHDHAPQQRGTTIRLSLKPEESVPKIGDQISTRATLFRPTPADAPGAFDMAKFSYFRGFGATGYPTTEISIVANTENATYQMSALRDTIHQKIAAHGNVRATALVDALVLGHGRTIERADADAARAAGIAHIFSISGFHLTLIGGWIFAFFYFSFRTVAPLTRRMSARVPALVCTWVLLLFFLSISGAIVTTQRAFIMATLGFIALAFSRTIISLRNVCLVFGTLILLNPHYVMEIGFQLSFAAIFGLTYFLGKRRYENLTRLQKIRRAVRFAVLATIAATIFTEPLIAYHFHSVQIYTLLGNLLCVPFFSVLIMPLVIIGTITGTLFGFFLPLDLAAYSYYLVMMLTNWIAMLPHSMMPIPRIPGISMILSVLAAIVMMFTVRETKSERRYIYTAVAALMICAVLIAVTAPRPIFYASHNHELVAFMRDDGKLQFNKARASNHRMSFDSWDALNGNLNITLHGNDNANDRRPIRDGFTGDKYRVDCRDKVCIFTTPNWKLAYIQQFVPLYKNIGEICESSEYDFLVSYFRINAPNCTAEILKGGFVIYESGRVQYTPANRVWHGN